MSSIWHVTFCKICGYAQNRPGRRASPRGRRREKDAGTALRTGRRLRVRRRAAREAGEGPYGLIGRPPSSPGPPCRLPAVAARAAGGDPGLKPGGAAGPPQGPPAQTYGRRRLAGRVKRPPRPHGHAAQRGGLAGVEQQRLDGRALRLSRWGMALLPRPLDALGLRRASKPRRSLGILAVILGHVHLPLRGPRTGDAGPCASPFALYRWEGRSVRQTCAQRDTEGTREGWSSEDTVCRLSLVSLFIPE